MSDRDCGGEFREHPPSKEGVGKRENDLNVRKRVRTDREQVRVPTRHEEANVERAPVNEERTGAEISEDVVPVPVIEEEVRIRKDVVQDEEVVEEDVRKEEVDVVDATTTTRGRGRDKGLDD